MLNKNTFYLCALLYSISTPSYALEDANSESIYAIWMNGIDLKRDIILKKIDQHIYIACSELESSFIDLNKLTHKSLENISYCEISNSPLQFEIDENQQILKLKIPISSMNEVNNYNFKNNLIPQKAPFGGYFNYNAYYQNSDAFHLRNQFSFENEIGIFKNNSIFKNGMITRYNIDNDIPNQYKTTRLYTNFTVEQPELLTQIQFGDNINPANANTHGFYFAGIQWGTNFMSRPGFVYWNVPTVQGSALVPSTVDLYINGINTYSNKINPGEYNINTGAFLKGDGTAQVIVQDITGNKTVQNIDISITDHLLQKGLMDYNIAVGRIRYNYDTNSNDYRDYFGSAYFRKGITKNLTLGLSSQYSKDIQNNGLLWSNYIHRIGAIDLGFAHSDSKKGSGETASFALTHDNPIINWGIGTQFYTKSYKMLGMLDTDTIPKREISAYLGFNKISYLGNITLNYIEQTQQKGNLAQDNKFIMLRGNKSLNKKIFFNYGMTYNLIEKAPFSFNLALTYRFNSKKSIYVNQSDNSTNINFVKYDSQNVGLDYAIGVGHMDNYFTMNAQSKLKTNYGDLNTAYYNNNGKNTYQAAYRGALVWLDNSFAMSKYVDYPFTLVKVENSPNIDIYKNNSFIGKTNKNGELFVPRLIPYTSQNISFNQDQLSVDDKIQKLNQNVIPFDLRGYIVNFPIVKTHELIFKFYDQNHQKLPTGSLVSIDNDLNNQFPIDSNGLVTLYGITQNTRLFSIKVNQNTQCESHFVFDNSYKSQDIIELECK